MRHARWWMVHPVWGRKVVRRWAITSVLRLRRTTVRSVAMIRVHRSRRETCTALTAVAPRTVWMTMTVTTMSRRIIHALVVPMTSPALCPTLFLSALGRAR